MPQTTQTVTVKKWQGDKAHTVQDALAIETPVALAYNGISHAVMLASPQDLEDFALGFSLSESIIAHASQLYAVEIEAQETGFIVNCEIANEAFAHLKQRRRTLAGNTGCGLCGADNLSQAIRPIAPLAQQHTFSRTAVLNALQALPQHQMLQQQTGAMHACAYVSAKGEVILVREDVGRHNALDKLVGAMQKLQTEQVGFIVTTSRASYEMVQKTVRAGVNLLVAVSAPTSLAVEMATQSGLTLLGFARGESFVGYTHTAFIE